MHQIKKKFTGGYTVNYECPSCSAGLVSPISEAGTNQQCPTCNHIFVVPGKEDVLELNRKLAEKREIAEAETEAKRIQAAEETKAKAEKKALVNAATAESERLAKIAYRRRLLTERRDEALKPNRHARGTPLGLSLVFIVLAIGEIISVLMAILAAITIIGIPVAVGCIMSFFVLLATNELLHICNDIRNNTSAAAEDFRFLSSLLDEVHSDVR